MPDGHNLKELHRMSINAHFRVPAFNFMSVAATP
jgi:hypothetical protein